MTVRAFLAAVRGYLLDAIQTWGLWTPGAWCRKQRRLLASGGSVVWVRGDAVPWAEWGARRGYFEVQYRALGAPAA